MKVAGIILAAGASRRLGTPKQLATIGGRPLLERAVYACQRAGLHPVFVVLGAHADEIMAACHLEDVNIVQNAEWQEGAASSVRAGVRALVQEPVDAIVMMTCDMPFVDEDHLRALVALAEREQTNSASSFRDWRGVPACYLRSSFPDLLALQGDTGGRKLLADAPVVELRNGLDVDTLADLSEAEAEYRKLL